MQKVTKNPRATSTTLWESWGTSHCYHKFHLKDPQEFWSNVLWTDELTIERFWKILACLVMSGEKGPTAKNNKQGWWSTELGRF